MMKRSHPYSPQTVDTVQALGLEIARARRERRWTLATLAERAGVSVVTLRQVERGSPTVAIGTAFELATLVGIALFGAADRTQSTALRERAQDRLALLPSRVREPSGRADDDDF
jgi:transcriptional regulator with XRE-family HTH domain